MNDALAPDMFDTVAAVMENVGDAGWLHLLQNANNTMHPAVDNAMPAINNTMQPAVNNAMPAANNTEQSDVIVAVNNTNAALNIVTTPPNIFVNGMDVLKCTESLTVIEGSAGNCNLDICSWKETEQRSRNTFQCTHCSEIRHPYCSGTVLLLYQLAM